MGKRVVSGDILASEKGKIKFLSSYAKPLLNFQITWTILVFFPMALMILIKSPDRTLINP